MERRFQRLRDIPVAGPVDVMLSKYRWYCAEPTCDRLLFFESTPQAPCPLHEPAPRPPRGPVIRAGRAVSETALDFAVS